MKNRTKFIGLITLFIVAAAILLWPTKKSQILKGQGDVTYQPPQSPNIPLVPPQKGGNITQSNPMQELLQTPIKFYGMVLDQNGNPVSAAKVNVSVFNNMTKASPLNTISDASGKFVIQSKGMGLRIEITKSEKEKKMPGIQLYLSLLFLLPVRK